MSSTSYRDTKERRLSRDFLAGEKVVAVLSFESRVRKNDPVVPPTIGGVPLVGEFDTGQTGVLHPSAATKQRLLDQGLLTLRQGSDAAVCDVRGIEIAPGLVVSVEGIPLTEEPMFAAKAIGVVERDVLELGFAFLRQWKTVWEFGEKKLYLLER